ncbi:hypothetical protein [Peribacillus butanolivorans]|uniref:hypothetical protein n=1 Tax=Peribacillus butanolivorans TaxID=421767 RepID=UPI0036709C0D
MIGYMFNVESIRKAGNDIKSEKLQVASHYCSYVKGLSHAEIRKSPEGRGMVWTCINGCTEGSANNEA